MTGEVKTMPPQRCPYCGSDEIGGGYVRIEDGQALQDCGCSVCDAEWEVAYQYVSHQQTRLGHKRKMPEAP